LLLHPSISIHPFSSVPLKPKRREKEVGALPTSRSAAATAREHNRKHKQLENAAEKIATSAAAAAPIMDLELQSFVAVRLVARLLSS
jgi:hypothetical protein